ncbi:hypothetical protein [Phreatobacter sp.]|uniref:hypothetical protein n=1 Tax=Phreatobacter sp. TaxID=1966341 RepID=UPI003F701DE0
MHTVMVISAGLLLLAATAIVVRRAGADGWMIPKIVLPLWLLASLVNMWVGVTRAGYSVAVETPILLLVFGVPALAALAAGWRLSRR